MSGLVVLDAARAAGLAELHATAFPHPWSAEAFAQLMAGAGVAALGVETEAGLDGAILIQAVAGEAEILTLAVRPGARRRGLAASLVEAAALAAKDTQAQTLWLEVAEDNLAALALYSGHGFSEAGRRRGYYQSAGASRIDAIVMRRALNTGVAWD